MPRAVARGASSSTHPPRARSLPHRAPKLRTVGTFEPSARSGNVDVVKRLMLFVTAGALAACGLLGGTGGARPEVVEPETSGVVTRIVDVSGAVERWVLDNGATVEFDLNKTILGYQTNPPAVGNLVVSGTMSQGRWVMQLGPGELFSPKDCFAVRLPAFDRADSIEFEMGTAERVGVHGGWRVRIPKTPTFGWQPFGSPGKDGAYPPRTRICLNGRGQASGEPPA
jgi:hypothetical protein